MVKKLRFLAVLILAFVSLHASELDTNSNPIILHTQKNKKSFDNVIQGVCFFKDKIVTTQTSKNKYLTFNILNDKGTSVYDKTFKLKIHGQDLSLLTNNKEVFLVTNGKHWHGISLFKLLLNKKKYDIKYVKHIPVNIGKMTITASHHNRYIIMAGNHSIYIYSKNILDKNNLSRPLFSFVLDIRQQEKNSGFKVLQNMETISMC